MTDQTVARLQRYLGDISRQYPDIWRNVDKLRAERGRAVPQWPSWCFMPLAGAYAIASGGRDDAPPEKLASIAAIGALAAWRTTQGIYRFDETVADAVWDTPLEGDLPGEILQHLPEWCVYIETPGRTYFDAESPGFLAWLEYDAGDRREELRLAIDTGAGLSTALPVHLGAGLVAGIERAIAEAGRQAAVHAIGPDQQQILSIPAVMAAESLAPRINLLLYLCSANAEMRDKAGRTRPSRPTLTKTKNGMRMFPPDLPAAWDVGFRLGAAIAAAQNHGSKAAGGTHASPRAHLRKAHWHSFWTGPKALVGKPQPTARKLVVKWLPPVPVNVTEEAGVIPTLHKCPAR